MANACRPASSGQPEAVCHLAWRAQERLHAKARGLLGRGKRSTVAVTAVARELAGFVWAVWHLDADRRGGPGAGRVSGAG